MYIASIAAALALFGALISGAGVDTPNRWQGLRLPRAAPERSGRNERGEGVISAAIAVLIIASLGALMWVGFKTLWENAEETTNSEIAKIGK